jgi:hypothetical protein
LSLFSPFAFQLRRPLNFPFFHFYLAFSTFFLALFNFHPYDISRYSWVGGGGGGIGAFIFKYLSSRQILGDNYFQNYLSTYSTGSFTCDFLLFGFRPGPLLFPAGA